MEPDVVTRGYPPPAGDLARILTVTRRTDPPLAMAEWQAVVAADPRLATQADHLLMNPHLERVELWREHGRARWRDGPAGHRGAFHHTAGWLDCQFGGPLRGGKLYGRAVALRRRLPAEPALADWQAIVAADRFLCRDQVPGRALWIGKDGRVKGALRFVPAGVWIDLGTAGVVRPDLRDLCEDIANRLGAEVLRGSDL